MMVISHQILIFKERKKEGKMYRESLSFLFCFLATRSSSYHILFVLIFDLTFVLSTRVVVRSLGSCMCLLCM
jgi:hypothetical protein